MAERAASSTGTTRRQSFRKSLAEAGLPQEYLDALEQKRRQLDESIHKYIAAKEREYKQAEKELRQQYKLSQDKDAVKPRRTSSESTQDASETPRLHGQHQSVMDVLMAAGMKRDQIGQSVALAVVDDDDDDGPPTLEPKSTLAGMTDRRASIERDKEFVGVFTPAFLPALDNKAERGSSEPPPPTTSGNESRGETDGIQRANSDSAVPGKGKRPAQLQLVQRTSSSGSSADGKLASAMKSTSHASKQPKRKRVSIAVGNSIVAPSDNVPVDLSSNNHPPSHSRTRSPASEREAAESKSARAVEALKDAQRQAEAKANAVESSKPLTNGNPLPGKQQTESLPAVTQTASSPSSNPKRTPRLDPDGDLFDLDDEDTDTDAAKPEPIPDDEPGIAGRVDPQPRHLADGDLYDPNAGIIPDEHDESEGTSPADTSQHLEYAPPGSSNTSQQPTQPGFRRPSVSSDPVYMGANYARAEHNAVVNDVYGSSYNRPASKGSFTAGSLGESFMARNAEMLQMRHRAPREGEEVRS